MLRWKPLALIGSTTVLAASLGLVAPSAGQSVEFVTGTINEPSGLKRGDVLTPGRTVNVGEDGMVVIRDSWQSDRTNHQCVRWVVISNNRYRVEAERPRKCPVQDDAADLSQTRIGQPLLAKNILYADVMFDEGKADRVLTPFELALRTRIEITARPAPQPGQPPTPRPDRPQGFPLSCRGGAALDVQYIGALNEVLIRFTRAAGPARQRLRPGECSWHDRAIGPQEPALLCHRVDRLNLSWRPNRAVSVSTGEARYLEQLGNSGQVFELRVYNDPDSNPRCLRVTDVPPG